VTKTVAGIAAVAAGGALGAVARLLVGRAVQGDAAFPRGTLVVNVSGCLVFGLLAGLFAAQASDTLRLFVFTGVLGGFTTFSSFGSETILLARTQPLRAMAYVVLSVGLGLVAVVAGQWIGTRIRG
jgi:CrcB protein